LNINVLVEILRTTATNAILVKRMLVITTGTAGSANAIVKSSDLDDRSEIKDNLADGYKEGVERSRFWTRRGYNLVDQFPSGPLCLL